MSQSPRGPIYDARPHAAAPASAWRSQASTRNPKGMDPAMAARSLPQPNTLAVAKDYRGGVSLAASLLFVAAIAALWGASGDATLAVYAVSFWHYCLYVFAFAYRSVRLADFRRDAM